MLDPRTVMVGVPCHSGQNMTELTGMLITNRDLYAAITMPTECSHPSLVRNIMADTFLRSGLDWFVGIDSDIVPARCDFQFLLEPLDAGALYFDADRSTLEPHDRASAPPTPTRVHASVRDPQLSGDMGSTALCDVLVCAEYPYKREPFEPVQFGGGFYRVHKSVFNLLANLKHPDNGRVEVDRDLLNQFLDEDARSYEIKQQLIASITTSTDTPRLWQCTHNGRMFYDFYPSGAMLSAGLPHGDWKGEDHGFWTLCRLAGLIPRIERRTRLIHIGRKAYGYEGPDQGGGQ